MHLKSFLLQNKYKIAVSRESRQSPNFLQSCGKIVVAGGVILAISSPATAEVLPVNALGSSGGSDLQIATGNAVQAVCGQFIAANNEGTAPANEQQADLFDKCGEMVHSANALLDNGGATAKSLNLSEAELQGALQNIAGEEAGASGSMATEASSGQAANISKRLSALLSRSSSMQLSAVNVFGNDGLYTVSLDDKKPLSGGAAGEGDLLDSRVGVFVNGDMGSGEKTASAGEDGFDYDSTGLTLGVDYRLNNQTVFGVAAGINNSESSFKTNDLVSGGGMDAKATTLSLYAMYYNDSYYIDGIVSAGSGSFEMERHIVIKSNSGDGSDNDGADRLATSDTDSSQLSVSVGVGTDIINGAMTLAPYGRAQLLKVDVDGFQETGADGLNLEVKDQEIDSLTSTLGFRASIVSNASFAVLIPQARIEWVHEFSDDAREVSTVYVNDPRQNELVFSTDAPDRDYFNLGVGVSAVFSGGTQAFVDVKKLVGLRDFDENVVTVGVRFEL